MARQLRDMTPAEFHRRLKKRGWYQVLLWIDLGTGRSVGIVCNADGTINRRATLAHAVREYDRQQRESVP